MRRRTILILFPAVVLMAAVTAATSAPRSRGNEPVELDDASIIVEVNATDGDAGLQVFLDGKPWRSMTVAAPDGRRIVAINTRGRLGDHGLTEWFTESSEPSFDMLPLRRFKRIFPEGRYRFTGETIHGRRLVGSARLSHDIPDGPTITSPPPGGTVPSAGPAVLSWTPPPEPKGITIVGYRAIVEREDPLRVFSVDLPAAVTSVTIPREFLEPGTTYKGEVQAIEASGNQTLTEIEFRVA
jgi:hypothetical protein